WNTVRKAQRQTERGERDPLAGYLIPSEQHDPLTAAKLVEKLLGQGLEIRQAVEAFTVHAVNYGAGSYVVPLAQPKMGLIRTVLGRTLYPDDAWTRHADGSPISPYDTATDTFAEFMGVRVEPIQGPLTGRLEIVSRDAALGPSHTGRLPQASGAGYLLD